LIYNPEKAIDEPNNNFLKLKDNLKDLAKALIKNNKLKLNNTKINYLNIIIQDKIIFL
jgi:hypothetical protein